MDSIFLHFAPASATLGTYAVCRLLNYWKFAFVLDCSMREAKMRKQATVIIAICVFGLWHFLVLFRQLFPMDHTTLFVELILLIYAIIQGYAVFLHVFIPTARFTPLPNMRDEEKMVPLQIESAAAEDDRLTQDLQARLDHLRGDNRHNYFLSDDGTREPFERRDSLLTDDDLTTGISQLRQTSNDDGTHTFVRDPTDRTELLRNLLRFSAIAITPANVRFLARSVARRNAEINDV